VLCEPLATLSALGVVFFHPIPRTPDIKFTWYLGGHVRASAVRSLLYEAPRHLVRSDSGRVGVALVMSVSVVGMHLTSVPEPRQL
jgi:hypothetical protein